MPHKSGLTFEDQVRQSRNKASTEEERDYHVEILRGDYCASVSYEKFKESGAYVEWARKRSASTNSIDSRYWENPVKLKSWKRFDQDRYSRIVKWARQRYGSITWIGASPTRRQQIETMAAAKYLNQDIFVEHEETANHFFDARETKWLREGGKSKRLTSLEVQ